MSINTVLSNSTAKNKTVTGYWLRENGLVVEIFNGGRTWWLNGFIHNNHGPAINHPHNKCWYQNGKLHRLDGPAVEFAYGKKEYWINNIEYSTYLEYIVAVEQHKE